MAAFNRHSAETHFQSLSNYQLLRRQNGRQVVDNIQVKLPTPRLKLQQKLGSSYHRNRATGVKLQMYNVCSINTGIVGNFLFSFMKGRKQSSFIKAISFVARNLRYNAITKVHVVPVISSNLDKLQQIKIAVKLFQPILHIKSIPKTHSNVQQNSSYSLL